MYIFKKGSNRKILYLYFVLKSPFLNHFIKEIPRYLIMEIDSLKNKDMLVLYNTMLKKY